MAENAGWGMDGTEAANMKKAYDAFNGLEVFLTLWEYDNYSCYHLSGWEKEIDSKIRDAVYFLEQDPVSGGYPKQRKRFNGDWEDGSYAMPGSLTFRKEDVEVLEVMCEERKE